MNVTQVICSLVCGVILAYFGYRLGINKDKRSEFNSVAEVIANKLRRHVEDLRNYTDFVTVEEFERLLDRESALRREGLKRAWNNYNQALNEFNQCDLSVLLLDEKRAVAAKSDLQDKIATLLTFTKRR